MYSNGGLLSVMQSYLKPSSFNATRTYAAPVVEEFDVPDDSEPASVQRVFGLDCSTISLASRLHAIGEEFPIRPEPMRPCGTDASVPIMISDDAEEGASAPSGSATSSCPGAAPAPDDDEPEVIVEQQAFYDLIKCRPRGSSDFLPDLASRAINVSSGLKLISVERGSVSFETKNKSLWNRWFGGRGSSSVVGAQAGSESAVMLKRNHTFEFAPVEGADPVMYRVVNIFRKKSAKGTKWLLHPEGEARNDTIVHAQLLAFDPISDAYFIDAGLGRRFAPHAFILCRGNEVSGRIGYLSAYDAADDDIEA